MKTSQTHYLSLIGFLLFAGAGMLVFLVGFILGLSVLTNYFSQGIVEVPSAVYTVTIFFTGTLLAVVSIISLLRFMNKPFAFKTVSTNFEGWKIAAGVIGVGLVLVIGNWLQGNQSINWLVLPLLTVPAVILPIWTLMGLAARGLSLGTRWRTWGAFGISLTVTPFVLFMLETVVLIVIVVIAIIIVAANPDWAAEFEKLSSQFAFIDPQSEAGVRLLIPYLSKPMVVIPATIFIAIIVPLMEELLKPLAVWALAWKLDSAAQGFAFGALSGAGFAIWETFNVSGQTAEWSAVLFTRIGTGLLHITTSALMGSAIFLAIREKRYLRLFGTYLLAVLLHGLWNASAITVSFSALLNTYEPMKIYETLQWGSTIGLAVLAVALFTLLITSNRRLYKVLPGTTLEEVEVQATQNDTDA